MTEIIRIIFTEDDVRSIAEAYDVDPEVALERAEEWGRHIGATAAQLCNDQLESVITLGTP